MKKIIITCIIFLMIAGATIGVLQWFNIGPFSDIDSVSEQFSNQAQAKIQIFSLDPVVIHFVQDDKVISVIKIELKLRNLTIKELNTLKLIAEWREKMAQKINIPRNWVISDKLLINVVRKKDLKISIKDKKNKNFNSKINDFNKFLEINKLI